MLKSKIKNQKSKITLFLICFFYLLILVSGCTTMREWIRGIAGVSTKVLEDNRKSAIVNKFNYDYFSCYTKTLDILKGIGAHIYTQDIKMHMIAIYVSEQDTTPVGLFFKEIDKSNTQVEVSSPSKYAKELIAEKVYNSLSMKK